MAALVTLAACSGQPGDGVDARPDRRAELVEEVRIDGYASDLVPIGAVAEAADGTIAVTQAQDFALRFFDRDGREIGSFGRRGAGPGEYSLLSPRLGWTGDTLWTSDPSLGRLTLIAPDRSLVRTVRWPTTAQPPDAVRDRIPPFAFTYADGIAGDGSFLAQLENGTGSNTPALFRHQLVRARISGEGGIERLIARVPLRPARIAVANASTGVPFANQPRWGSSPDGKWFVQAYAHDDGPEAGQIAVSMHDTDGAVIFDRRYAFERVPIPARAADSARTALASRTRNPALAAAVHRATIPAHFPPVEAVLVGDDRSTWIRVRTGLDHSPYLVLGPDGSPEGYVELRRFMRLAVASRDRIWVIDRDGVGVDHLIRYAVRWPD